MPRGLRAFALTVAGLGLAGVVWTLVSEPVEVGPVAVVVPLALAGVVVAARPLTVSVNGEARDVELDEPLLAAAAFLVPGPGLFLVILPGLLAGNLAWASNRLKQVFNLGLMLASVAVMAAVVRAMGSPLDVGVTPRSVAGVVLGVAAMSSLSYLGVHCAVSLASGNSFLSRAVIKDGFVHMLAGLLGTLLGVLAGAAGMGHPWVTLLVVPVFAGLAAVLSRLVAAVGDRARLDGLLRVTARVHETLSRDEVEAALVTATADLLGSAAELRDAPAGSDHLATLLGDSGRWLVVLPRHKLSPFTTADERLLQAIARIGTGALDNVRLMEQVRHQALHDQLTGLPNAAMLERRLTHALRQGGALLVVALDLDRFTRINDAYGDATGDVVLREVARRLEAAVGPVNTVSRRSGDEFVILLTGCDELQGCGPILARVRATLAEPLHVEGEPVHLTASMGTARSPDDGLDEVALLRATNVALWTAKQEGGDRVVAYADYVEAPSRETLRLESDLHAALDRGELRVVYQPKIDVRSGRVEGFEALVRWQHPELGTVGPDRFLPIAERSELMARIDLWVMQEGLGQLTVWHAQGRTDLSVAVNLSPRVLAVPDLVRRVVAAADNAAVPLSCLHVEITEKVASRSAEHALSVLAGLRSRGVTVAVDDFGTGHSSLSRLRDLPVDQLKIDQSFVRSIGQARGEEAIIEATIAMAHGLGLRVVAEGVETQAHLDYLAGVGCDVAQGYLIAKPLGADESTRWLESYVAQVLVPAPRRPLRLAR